MDKKSRNREIRRISSSVSLTLIVYFILYTALNVGIQLVLDILSHNRIIPDAGILNLIVYSLLYLIIVPISLLCFYKLFGRKSGYRFSDCLKKPERSVGWVAKWIIISLGLIYIANMLSSLFFALLQNSTGYELTSKELQVGDSILGVIPSIIAVSVLAPIFEEIFFRGTLCRGIEPMGQWFAAITSGLVFGLWHLNYSQLVPAAAMGTIASLLYLKTRSVYPSIIVHFLVNSFSVAALLCMNGLDIDRLSSGTDINYALSKLPQLLVISLFGLLVFGLMITSLVLLIIELVRRRGRAGMLRGAFDCGVLKRAAVYISAPATIIVFAFMITVTVLNAMGYNIM